MAAISMLKYGNLLVTSAVTDEMLARAYFQMKKDGTLPVVYYDHVPSLVDFLQEHMDGGPRFVVGCFRDNGTAEPEFCGLGWSMNHMVLNGFRKSDIGFTFFKANKGKDSVDFGRMMLKVLLETFEIDALFGMTPEDNKLAVRYIQKVGMAIYGPVPQMCSWEGRPAAVWISHISREQFMERGYLEGAVMFKGD